MSAFRDTPLCPVVEYAHKKSVALISLSSDYSGSSTTLMYPDSNEQSPRLMA
ncbi:MAG TPA: hypothetical protein PKY21_01325 [Paludibacteraceae bacterium]|nr:hypothetical protein [Bacteroidales bacterium]HPK19899.1 hypothetical protein [Paludibacteraceae bacterium]